MKTENQAWLKLQQHAAAQLRPDFADRTLHYAQGPAASVWQQLRAHAAAQLRPGFATRVLRAARALPDAMPTILEEFVFGAATTAVCLMAVVYLHSRTASIENERNLAGWQQLADEAGELDQLL